MKKSNNTILLYQRLYQKETEKDTHTIIFLSLNWASSCVCPSSRSRAFFELSVLGAFEKDALKEFRLLRKGHSLLAWDFIIDKKAMIANWPVAAAFKPSNSVKAKVDFADDGKLKRRELIFWIFYQNQTSKRAVIPRAFCVNWVSKAWLWRAKPPPTPSSRMAAARYAPLSWGASINKFFFLLGLFSSTLVYCCCHDQEGGLEKSPGSKDCIEHSCCSGLDILYVVTCN